jgi:DNA-directed RNA polymerase subunit RPC12/RpoP
MIKCDFCGSEFESVRRVAVDSDYDRLSVKHEKQYACAECSAKKERERTEKDSSSNHTAKA